MTPTSDIIVGIDLGTTNSLVAWCDDAGPRILPDERGRNLLPSVVRFSDQTGQVEAVGHDARDHAVEFPRTTVFSIKRLMGRGPQDVGEDRAYLPYEIVEGPNRTARVRVGGRVWSPPEVSAVILRALKERADRFFGGPVGKAVITVPAYFDDAQRQATRDAGRLAGLDVVRIVNEPTAASLAYNLGLADPAGDGRDGVLLSTRHTPSACDTPAGDAAVSAPAPAADAGHTVAVYDLGGGTFDVSILRLQASERGVVDQVLATAGDTHLGGDDVDRTLVGLFEREITERFGLSADAFGPHTRQAMRTLAEAIKTRLSEHDRARAQIDLGGGRVYERTLTRGQFEELIGPWVERTLVCCRAVLRAAGLAARDIDRVVMVGGSTRIPLVRRRVAEAFQTEPYTALNPDEVVALGAAVQASILAGSRRDLLLLDVIPLSLGIETLGGAVAKLITANTTIPARATEMFTTHAEGQTRVKLHVVQGERELVKDCRSLAEFELTGLPPMPAGLPKVEVTFVVDASGVLHVEAVERRSERRARVQVVPTHGLSREEVGRMERESFEHAREDMTAHRLIDLRNQARLDLRAIERQLARVGHELPADERATIRGHMMAVRAMAEDPHADADRFAEALTTMDHATLRLAERAIAASLREA